MEKIKFKLREKDNNEKELLNTIEEKELQIVEYKNKLELAHTEINSLKSEVEYLKEKLKEFDEEENELENNLFDKEIETLTLGQATIDYKLNSLEEKLNITEIEENNKNESFELANVKIEDSLNEEFIIENDIELDESNLESVNITLIDDLKKAFIENDNYQCIEMLNLILKSIKDIEGNIDDSDIIILIYLSYFYDKFESLLKESEIINEYYLNLKENKEIKLLKMLIDEKDYPMYKEVNECIHSELKKEKKLFNNLNTMIKVRIIDRINNISYRAFDVVYSINDIEYGEETLSVKAWVKEKNGFIWRVVEGLYSSSKEKLYMLESSIYVLKLNINESINKEIESKILSDSIKLESKTNIVVKDKTNITEPNKKIIQENECNEDKVIESNDENKQYKWNSFKDKIVSKFKKSDN